MIRAFCKTAKLLLLPALLTSACIDVPNEVPSADSPRKATATVDSNGRTITGGHLTLIIPSGAIPIGERIQVTIDLITGSPEGHVKESYLVSPEGYHFQQAIEVQYQYSARMIENVSEPQALFVGVANGTGWNRLSDAQNDTGRFLATAKVAHFSVFGLIDPNAGNVLITDGGPLDSTSSNDAGHSDSGHSDSSTSNDAAVGSHITFELTWDNLKDLDLHLLKGNVAPFDDSYDCNYLSCSSPLDWPPEGDNNNPLLELDDTNGFGPERISISRAVSGQYSLVVQIFSNHQVTGPANFHVKIFDDGELQQQLDQSAVVCGTFYYVADIIITDNGHSINITSRSDSVILSEHPGGCS